jgi:hypothetical protein
MGGKPEEARAVEEIQVKRFGKQGHRWMHTGEDPLNQGGGLSKFCNSLTMLLSSFVIIILTNIVDNLFFEVEFR